jgi:hypothetical protein
MSSPEDRDKEPFDWFGRFFGRVVVDEAADSLAFLKFSGDLMK